MTHFGSKIVALFVAAALVGCDPPATEDQPQEGEQPGVDMDADTDPDVDVTVKRPETTPETDATIRSERPTPEFQIPTDTPAATGTQDDAEIPEIDLDAPQTEGAGAAGQGADDAEVPEIDLDAPSTEGAAVTEEEGGVTLPEIDPES